MDEKFVKEFLAKLEVETNKHKPAVAWERRHLRDQALLGVCFIFFSISFPSSLFIHPIM